LRRGRDGAQRMSPESIPYLRMQYVRTSQSMPFGRALLWNMYHGKADTPAVHGPRHRRGCLPHVLLLCCPAVGRLILDACNPACQASQPSEQPWGSQGKRGSITRVLEDTLSVPNTRLHTHALQSAPLDTHDARACRPRFPHADLSLMENLLMKEASMTPVWHLGPTETRLLFEHCLLASPIPEGPSAPLLHRHERMTPSKAARLCFLVQACATLHSIARRTSLRPGELPSAPTTHAGALSAPVATPQAGGANAQRELRARDGPHACMSLSSTGVSSFDVPAIVAVLHSSMHEWQAWQGGGGAALPEDELQADPSPSLSSPLSCSTEAHEMKKRTVHMGAAAEALGLGDGDGDFRPSRSPVKQPSSLACGTSAGRCGGNAQVPSLALNLCSSSAQRDNAGREGPAVTTGGAGDDANASAPPWAVDLSHNALTDEALALLALGVSDLPSLHSLDISHNPGVTAAGLGALCAFAFDTRVGAQGARCTCMPCVRATSGRCMAVRHARAGAFTVCRPATPRPRPA
jgi:Leucine Rich repeat